jgi:hypothetical protein
VRSTQRDHRVPTNGVTAYNLGGTSTTLKPFAICAQKKQKC